MTLLKLCGLILLLAVTLLLMRELGGRATVPVLLSGGIALLLFLLDRYAGVLTLLDSLPKGELLSSAVTLSLRVLGLCLLTEMTASLCRDMGEARLAAGLEWCGRAEILLVSLPTLSRILDTAVSYLGE